MLSRASAAHAEMTAEELAKLAQNPVGNLISLPFQNNTNLNFGPEKGTQNILNIQPVIPISIEQRLEHHHAHDRAGDLECRRSAPASTARDGVGDTVFTAFLSPANPGHWIWGAGPVVQIPTNSSSELGNKNWGLGPSFVVLHLEHGSPWVYGVLVNNIWSLTSNEQGGAYNNGLIQPFVNYNFKDGFYLTSAPILTVDWKADSSQQWTVPIGGGVGKIFHLGKLPVNTQLSRVLQRRAARLPGQLADSRASAAHVPEVTGPSGFAPGQGFRKFALGKYRRGEPERWLRAQVQYFQVVRSQGVMHVHVRKWFHIVLAALAGFQFILFVLILM